MWTVVLVDARARVSHDVLVYPLAANPSVNRCEKRFAVVFVSHIGTTQFDVICDDFYQVFGERDVALPLPPIFECRSLLFSIDELNATVCSIYVTNVDSDSSGNPAACFPEEVEQSVPSGSVFHLVEVAEYSLGVLVSDVLMAGFVVLGDGGNLDRVGEPERDETGCLTPFDERLDFLAVVAEGGRTEIVFLAIEFPLLDEVSVHLLHGFDAFAFEELYEVLDRILVCSVAGVLQSRFLCFQEVSTCFSWEYVAFRH